MDRYQRVEKPKAETPIDEKEIRISSQGKLIKKRIVGLHQITSIGSTDITDMWEPLEEGLVPLETTRHVSIITITLSKIELNMSSAGYQPPLPANQDGGRNHNRGYDRGRGRGSRGRGRGGYNGQQADRMEDGGYNYEAPPQGGRGKG
ncbi:hypothetical protein Goshw_013984, partial [Gossypium schwendimanii]|nr:hypothetical protein [Gossypium schwendimanii]